LTGVRVLPSLVIGLAVVIRGGEDRIKEDIVSA